MQRVVTRLPLSELWNDAGAVRADLIRDLAADDIRELLRAGPVQFVVADVAAPLRWVPVDDCFRFWKSEVVPRMGAPSGAPLEAFPGGYCYFASEWGPVEGPPVVVLSIAH
jgi:hypothetical protein